MDESLTANHCARPQAPRKGMHSSLGFSGLGNAFNGDNDTTRAPVTALRGD